MLGDLSQVDCFRGWVVINVIQLPSNFVEVNERERLKDFQGKIVGFQWKW